MGQNRTPLARNSANDFPRPSHGQDIPPFAKFLILYAIENREMGLNPPMDCKERTTRQYKRDGGETTRITRSLFSAPRHDAENPTRSTESSLDALRSIMQNTPLFGVKEKRKKNKRVRFNENSKVIYGAVLRLDEYTIEELRSCWWDEKEREGTRLNAKYLSSQAKKSFFISKIDSSFKQIHYLNGYGRLPVREFVSHTGETFLQSNVLLAGDIRCQSNDALYHLSSPLRHIVSHLVKWSTIAHSVRGLERWASPTHNKLRFELAKGIRETILNMYSANRFSEDEIASHYARLGCTSVLFARLLGFADGVAAGAIRYVDGFAIANSDANGIPACNWTWTRHGRSSIALGSKEVDDEHVRTVSLSCPTSHDGLATIMLSPMITANASAWELLS